MQIEALCTKVLLNRYAGDRVSQDGQSLAIYYKCAQAEQEDETTCSGSMRAVFSLAESACAPHPLFASADRVPLTPASAASKITRFYGSSSRTRTFPSSAQSPAGAELKLIPMVVTKIRLTHLAKHARAYGAQKAFMREQERKRRWEVKKLDRLLAKLQDEVKSAKMSTKLADVSGLLEKLEDIVADDSDTEYDNAGGQKKAAVVRSAVAQKKPNSSCAQGKRKRSESTSETGGEEDSDSSSSDEEENGAADECSGEVTDYHEPEYTSSAKNSSARARKNTSRWSAAVGRPKGARAVQGNGKRASQINDRAAKKRRLA